MQTIYLDISNKGVVPTIYAKQGDVGRKFEVVFTNSGLPYVIADESFLSVWYSGESGEGNYTEINGHSAFTVNANKVAIEIITQALVNDGNGVFCLVLNEPGGRQIGSWNIPYICEAIPGFGSEEAKAYYTAFSDSIEKLYQTTENLTPEAIGAAPASLADYTPKGGRKNFCTNLLHVDLDNPDAYQNLAGVISTEDASTLVDSPVTSGAFYAYREVLFINSQVGNRPKVIVRLTEAYPQQNNVWINSYNPDSNTWSGWCWSSPPMRFGVEYRTTELWNDRAVYTRLVDCQGAVNGGTARLTSENAIAIRWSGLLSNNIPLPMIESDFEPNYCELSIYNNNGLECFIRCGGSAVGSNLKVQVWYVK